MKQTVAQHGHWLTTAQKEARQGFASLREAALAQFTANGFPVRRLEPWHYTGVDGLLQAHFTQADAPSVEGFDAHALTDADADVLSQLPLALPENSLVALNTVLMPGATVIDVPAGQSVVQPVIIHRYLKDGEMDHSRLVVRLGDGASLQLVDIYDGEGSNWANPVNQYHLGHGATLSVVRIQRESLSAHHTAAGFAFLADNAQLKLTALEQGGRVARHGLDVVTQGAGAHFDFNGLALGSGKQHLATITRLDHAVAQTTSDQLMKMILADTAHGVFQGQVTVHRDAQKVEAHQLNRNLLLHRTAQASSKPELIIHADDVKCSHGATVGELDQTQLFYLLARGIDRDTAQGLLLQGFAGEILDDLQDQARDLVLDAWAEGLQRLNMDIPEQLA